MEPKSIDRIFWEAAQLGSAEERQAYLEHICAGDVALRQRVEQFLQARSKAESFLESPPAVLAVTTAEPLAVRPGTVIGPYKLLEQIGEGGFGVVFMAEQQQPLRRKVALKLLKPGMDSRQVIARFEAERQALALMDHPNIAKVLDAGTTETGRPYFVMELVKGVPLTQFCDDHRLTTRQRLVLFVHVCQAVQHAHHKGVIHRDLKPSNVLVTLHDGTPVPKVIDFGIAKALGQQLTDKTIFTGFAQMIGTPLYMSPEQAGLGGLDIDTRSDVYALGVLLYELLTGTTPFAKERLRQAAYDEVLRIIREEEAPKPSTRISTLGQAASTVAEQRQIDPKRLSQLLRGELDWMVLKALEKDRTRRYATAQELADDLRRYLDDEPILARPPTLRWRVRKWARRHQVVVWSLVVGVLVGVTVLAGSIGWVLRDQGGRRLIAEEKLAEALADAEPGLIAGDPRAPDLIAAARKAEAQLAGGLLSEPSRQRLAALLADTSMLAQLENIPLSQAPGQQAFDIAAADERYTVAYQQYGINVDTLSVEEAARRIQSKAIRAHLVAALDYWARSRRQKERSGNAADWRQLLKVACAADPDQWRTAVRKAWEADDAKALTELAASAPDEEEPVPLLLCLWTRLDELTEKARQTEDVISLLRRQQRRHPANFWINYELASALTRLQPPQWGEASGFMRVALALRPKSPSVYIGLGYLLSRQRKMDEAMAFYKEALRLNPDNASCANNDIGVVLRDRGELDEALAFFKEAIRLQPNFPIALLNFVELLKQQGKADQAVTIYRQIVPLDSKFAAAGYNNLGWALHHYAQLDEAIVSLRQAIALKPDMMAAHGNLGTVLRDQGKLDEAIVCFREAICVKSDDPLPYHALGSALLRQGQFAEALEAYRQSRALGSKHPSLVQHINESERLVELDPQLPAILNGEAEPANTTERIGYAQLCYFKHHYAASAHFWVDAFAAEPKLADDAQTRHRYAAACAAALAGTGHGAGAEKLSESEQAHWRQQALIWLQADLAYWAERLKQGDRKGPDGESWWDWLGRWQCDPDLAGVRDAAALGRLPEAERQAWQLFWNEVETLRRRFRSESP